MGVLKMKINKTNLKPVLEAFCVKEMLARHKADVIVGAVDVQTHDAVVAFSLWPCMGGGVSYFGLFVGVAFSLHVNLRALVLRAGRIVLRTLKSFVE